MDNKNTKDIIALIESIAEKKFNEKLANTETVYDGVVDYLKTTDENGNEITHTDRLVVKVKGTEYEVPTTSTQANESGSGVYIRNESGKELTHGSIVRIYAKGDKLNNSYIGVVFDNNNNNKNT